jgi:hypothetical protein
MIRLTCNNCGTDYQFEDSELDFDCVSSDERQMGPENEYVGQIEFDCDKCKNHITVEFDFWEYPIGALNYSEYSEEGCVGNIHRRKRAEVRCRVA